MNLDLDFIIDDCLERLQSGQSVEDCLAVYPEQVELLQPLLLAAGRVHAAQAAQPRMEAVQAGRERMLTKSKTALRTTNILAAQAVSLDGFSRYIVRMFNYLRTLILGKETYGMKYALRITVLFLALAVVAGSLVVNASAATLPGDALYPVKLTMEQLHLSIMIHDRDRISYEEKLVDQRRAEIRQMIQHRISEEVEFEGLIEAIDGEGMLVSGLQLRMRPDAKMEGNPGVGQMVWVRARVENTGELTALQVQVRQATRVSEPAPEPEGKMQSENGADFIPGPPEATPCVNCVDKPCTGTDCGPQGLSTVEPVRARTQQPANDQAPGSDDAPGKKP